MVISVLSKNIDYDFSYNRAATTLKKYVVYWIKIIDTSTEV